jgi:cell wall-associated NlpC family hydrolase
MAAADAFPRAAAFQPAGRLIPARPPRRGCHRAPRQHGRAARTLITLALMLSMAAGIALAIAPSPAHASVTPARISALHWAEAQAGKWYAWGGTGPSTFDCSGLVYESYLRAAGVSIGRDTFDMLASGHLVQIRVRDAQRGDLLFYGTGHVELKTLGWHASFGALEPGTRIGWHRWNAWWHPTMAFRLR